MISTHLQLLIEKESFFLKGSDGSSGMSQGVSRCGEKNKAEAAGKHNRKGATPGALSVRQQQIGRPEQIGGSCKVTKKRLPWQIPLTSAAPAAPSVGEGEERSYNHVN